MYFVSSPISAERFRPLADPLTASDIICQTKPLAKLTQFSQVLGLASGVGHLRRAGGWPRK